MRTATLYMFEKKATAMGVVVSSAAMYEGWLFVAILIDIAVAIAAANTASEKGYSGVGFFLLGLILPVISLIIVVLLPDKSTEQASIEASESNRVASNADTLMKYKELLDSGAITQDEYDSVKSQVFSGMSSAKEQEIDDANPLRIFIKHRRNGRIVVEYEDRIGTRRVYSRTWTNEEKRDERAVSREIAEEVERETGRKVLWTML